MSTPIHAADLEPALFADQTYATRRRPVNMDAAFAFGVIICLLTLIPSRLILPGTSADVGRPGTVVGVLIFCWWVATRCNRRLAMPGPQPVRWAVLLYLVSLLISYAIGFERGLTPLEANAADRAMLAGGAAFIGTILVAADGISNWGRMRVALQIVVWCSVYMSIIGVLQQLLPFNIVEYLTVPGLTNLGVPGYQQRGDGLRVAATTTHYLELAATLSLALPVAIHFAKFASTQLRRRLFGVAALVIVAGVLVTISRTGIVSVVVALLILMPLWTWRARYNVLVLGLMAVAGMSAIKPSAVRTFYDIFANASNDSSITARTERYTMVAFYYGQRPWWGRGTGTWEPPMYQFLDNQWLRTALEAGNVGVAVLAVLHLTAIALAGIALRRASTPADRHLCLVLISTQVVALFIAYTFDSLTYTTYSLTLGMMIGLCGAVWRFTHSSREIRTSTPYWIEQ
ncbi:O-antigen ligase family protein [Micromonospora sp. NPDC006766]|uniref:O-antigen ligase family protein n=1 Tax=Micromonospora sp. NPDC006766 TaxID=3154778 RepID=UPI003408458B